MHDPWGGERPIDDDLLVLLFKDQEQPSLPFPEPSVLHPNPATNPPYNSSQNQSNMGCDKYTTHRKRKTTNSPSNQPATNIDGPSNDLQPLNFSPPDIHPKARPRNGH